MTLKVLHVMPSFLPATRYGGPIVSVHQLCRALLAAGVSVEVFTTNADGSGDLDVPVGRVVDCQGVPVTYHQRLPRTGYCISTSLALDIARRCGEFDLVHVTSTFSFPTLAACSIARRARVPYVVSPRGSLMLQAVARKRWKKTPYWWAFERAGLHGAAALHATSDVERNGIRSVLPSSPVFVVPNGVTFEAPGRPVARQRDLVLFLGRIHMQKGFDVLVPALSTLALRRPGVRTILAGPDAGARAEVESLLARCSPRPAVEWAGHVQGPRKAELLASASVLVMPSHGESFGQAIVEALAAGTPVVASRETPWEELERTGAGRWVENRPEVLARALEAILERMPDPAVEESARRLASRYTWDNVAAAMTREYERAARRGS